MLHRRSLVRVSHFTHHRLFASTALQNILISKLRETGRSSVFSWLVPETLITKKILFPAPLSEVTIRRVSTRRPVKSDSKKPLSNEGLIAFLVRKSGKSPEELQVRIIVEDVQKEASGDGVSRQKIVDVMSLKEAIKLATQLHVDIIDIDSRQPIPVVQLESLNHYEFKKRKKVKARMSKLLPDKELRFTPAIAENDLQRKIDQIIDYLEKGHKCSIRVLGIQDDSDSGFDLIDRIMERVGSVGELVSDTRSLPGGMLFCRVQQLPKHRKN